MKVRAKSPKLREFSFCWMLHFGIQLLMAFAMLVASLYIIFDEEAIIPGLALCCVAIYSFINGINGFRELIGLKKRGGYLRDN